MRELQSIEWINQRFLQAQVNGVVVAAYFSRLIIQAVEAGSDIIRVVLILDMPKEQRVV